MQYLEFEKSLRELDLKIEEALAAGKKEEAEKLQERLKHTLEEIYSSLTPWQKVLVARHPERPQTLDYIQTICDSFIEVHGDRKGGDDRAIITGIASIEGEKLFLIGQQKGKNVRERKERNFGMVSPEGYRKAMRVMKLAERFEKPVITLVDTPGAYPGIEAEEKGQAMAIAECIECLLSIKTPTLSIVIGEGGSGGALAICSTDRILMMQYSTLSVISPEGCASILFRNGTKAEAAAKNLKLSAEELKELGIVDEIIEEPPGGAHRDPDKTFRNVKLALLKNLDELLKLPKNELFEKRREKYSKMGIFRVET